MSASRTRVFRNGEPGTVPATTIVPGDIIVIEEGDTLPADARLIESTALHTAEAVLTGESQVLKEVAPITAQVGLGDRLLADARRIQRRSRSSSDCCWNYLDLLYCGGTHG